MSSDTAGPASAVWHTLDGGDATVRLSSDPDRGLSLEEVTKRQAQYGPNAIRAGKRRGAFAMLASQFTDFMILVLIAAAVIAGFIGEPPMNFLACRAVAEDDALFLAAADASFKLRLPDE